MKLMMLYGVNCTKNVYLFEAAMILTEFTEKVWSCCRHLGCLNGVYPLAWGGLNSRKLNDYILQYFVK